MKKYIVLALVFFTMQQTQGMDPKMQGTDLKEHSIHHQEIDRYKVMAETLNSSLQGIVESPYYCYKNAQIFSLVEYLAPVCQTLGTLANNIPSNDQRVIALPKLNNNLDIQEYYRKMQINIIECISIINELIQFISEDDNAPMELSMLNEQFYSLGNNLMSIFSAYSDLFQNNS